MTALDSLAIDLAVAGKESFFVNGPANDLNRDGFTDLLLSFRGRRDSGSELYLVLGRGRPLWALDLEDHEAFQRGDANADGRRNVADAIFILNYLFGGGDRPLCEDAADADDDETLDLADSVQILGRIFADGGDVPPPPPLAACGYDLLSPSDALGCVSFPPLPFSAQASRKLVSYQATL